MIETLARKRTNAVALAVLAALVAALFVALQSVSAAGCAANPGITLGTGDTCEVLLDGADTATSSETGVATVSTPDTDATNDVPDGQVTITAVAIGTTTVTLTNNGEDDTAGTDDDITAEYEVTVAGFAISKVAVKGDTDNVVSAGRQITVTATLRSAVAASDVRLTVPSTGLSIEIDPAAGTTSQSQTKNVGAAGTQTVEFTVNTAGAPAGDYTLTFLADQDGDFATTSAAPATGTEANAEGNKQDTEPLTVTIGDPGMGLASATLSLGNSVNDLPFTDKDETVAETGSDVAKATSAADGKINLVVEVFDSLGGKANSSAVNQIIVIAPGGSIEATRMNTATPPAPVTETGDSSLTLDEDGTDPPDVGQRHIITVSKEDEKPGQVTVYAIVSGPGGAARTEDVTLTFSGPAASLSVADATESLLSVNTVGDNPETDAEETDFVIKDTIKLLVTAEDEGGNSAVPPTGGVSIVITDPDGKRQGTSVIDRSQPTKGADGKYYITLTGTGSAASPLKAGTWTVDVKSNKLEASATFAVAGAPADVAVTASSTSSDTIGDVIVVTASVTDKDGNTVSNGTSVMFDVSANTGLAAIGTGHSGKDTKNGEASVKYAVVGAGNSVISATAGDATGVVVVVSTAGTADAADRGPRLGDFANGGSPGLTSYNGPDASASDLLALLAGRANAIWLSSGSGWVLYASADGAMVPGSMNFTATAGDVIYISN